MQVSIDPKSIERVEKVAETLLSRLNVNVQAIMQGTIAGLNTSVVSVVDKVIPEITALRGSIDAHREALDRNTAAIQATSPAFRYTGGDSTPSPPLPDWMPPVGPTAVPPDVTPPGGTGEPYPPRTTFSKTTE